MRGFYNFALLLQFIYRLRSPSLGRLWTLAAQICVSKRSNIEIGGEGFYNFVLLLQFIYRLRSPRLGRLWTLAAQMCVCV